MLNIPLPGQVYKHFKGKLYRVVTLARHSETGETLVIYQALYGDYQVYARPLSMFVEKIDKEKYPDALSGFRFELQKELIEPSALKQEEEEAVDFALKQAEETVDLEQGKAKEAAKAPALEQEEAGTFIPENTEEEPEEEIHLDPLVLEFLDADTYEKRLTILSALHDRITDDMINIMAISVGVEIEEGDTEGRFEELRSCLLTLGKYESNRLR